MIDFISELADLLLKGDSKERVKEICSSLEAKTFISFALDKRQNIDRDLLLRPEVRPIMIGHCGEGDLIFLLMKNSGFPPPLEDERIPAEYAGETRWEGNSDAPGNPANRPLFLGFAHAISSPTDYRVRPDPSGVESHAQLKTQVFSNYVDNALYCFKQGVFDRKASDTVVNASRKWLQDHQQEIDRMLQMSNLTRDSLKQEGLAISELPPALQYRIKLLRSVAAYDYYVAQHSTESH